MNALKHTYVLADGAVRNVADFTRWLELESATQTIRSAPDAYGLVPWVYRCTMLRCNAIAGLPFSITDSRGNEASVPFNMRDVVQLIEFALCIWGTSYTLIKRRGRRVSGLQWLNPETMSIRTDPIRGIVAYVQQFSGGRLEFAPEQIVHHKLPNPLDDVGVGVSPARVALDAARMALNANTYVAKFFANSAIPAVVLSTDQPMPDAETERVRTVWERLFGGVRNAFRTAVLRYGLKPTVIGSQMKDIVPAELIAAARQQIAVAFGVPQTLLEDAANYATAREHRLSFYYETIFPEADLIAEGLNTQLFASLGLRFEFNYNEVEAVQQDEATKANAVSQLVQLGIISTDEAREVMGFEPRAETTQQDTTAQGLPSEAKQDVRRWRDKALRRGPDVQFDSEAIPDWLANAIRARLATMPVREAFAPAVRAYERGGAERDLKQRIQEVYDAHRDKIAKAASAGEMPNDELNALADDLVSAVTAKLTLIAIDAALAMAVDFGVGVEYDNILTDAAAWAQRYAYDLVKGITNTQREHLQNVISQVVDGKLSREDAVSMIEPMFGEVRAEMIATTEVTRAMSAATELYTKQLRDAGYTIQVRWYTWEDERVCEICAPLDHTLEDVWRTVAPGGPPAHVNCRCKTVVEVVRK